ncbi:mCG145347, partial [Mus musculus]
LFKSCSGNSFPFLLPLQFLSQSQPENRRGLIFASCRKFTFEILGTLERAWGNCYSPLALPLQLLISAAAVAVVAAAAASAAPHCCCLPLLCLLLLLLLDCWVAVCWFAAWRYPDEDWTSS